MSDFEYADGQDPEERHCIQMIELLRKDYERAARPYTERLAKIRALRIPSITIPLAVWNSAPRSKE